jgi:hypothetical protein
VRFIGRIDANVAGQKLGGVFECGQGQGGRHLHGGNQSERLLKREHLALVSKRIQALYILKVPEFKRELLWFLLS